MLDALINWPGAKTQHFFFEGKPVPLARQKMAKIKTVFGKERLIAFTPKANKDNKDRIYSACLTSAPVRFQPPYSIGIKFICEPLKTVAEEYPTCASHGDLDNLEKLILDAIFFDMNAKEKRGIPVYQDDRHIVNCVKFKRLPKPGEKPGIHFWMVKP